MERKLVRNRGHHHTQIAAIEGLLSEHDIVLLTGEGYDGFLPYPARSITANASKQGRRARRNAYGKLPRRLVTAVMQFFSERYSHRSRLGVELLDAISGFDLAGRDVIIIPSATIDDLFAVSQAYERLHSSIRPQCHIRFLDPYLGEASARLREAHMVALLRTLPPEIHLYCETEEMADYMAGHFSHTFTGGFYLPCTLDPREEWVKPQKEDNEPFRVGVFGVPRKEKGATRIGAIIDAIGRVPQTRHIEFIVQGKESDFRPDGPYATVVAADSQVGIRQLVGALEPDDFRREFLTCDVILLPYDVSLYSLQGSGLVQDAVAANIPIVHSRGMSMKRLLDCGNASAATSDHEFAEAVVALVNTNQASVEGCRTANIVFRAILSNHPLGRV